MFFQTDWLQFPPLPLQPATQLSSAVVDGDSKAEIYKDVTLPPRAPLAAVIAD